MNTRTEAITIPVTPVQWSEARGIARYFGFQPSHKQRVGDWINTTGAILANEELRRVEITPDIKLALKNATKLLIAQLKICFLPAPGIKGSPDDKPFINPSELSIADLQKAYESLHAHPDAQERIVQWIIGIETALTSPGVRGNPLKRGEEICDASGLLLAQLQSEFPEALTRKPKDPRTHYLADDIISGETKRRRLLI